MNARLLLSIGALSCSMSLWAQAVPFGSLAPEDRISLVPEEQMPGGIPPQLLDQNRRQVLTKDVDGVSFVGEDEGLVRGLERTVEAIERVRVQARTKGLKQAAVDEQLYGLVLDPAGLPLTRPMAEMPEGRIIGATPSGTFKNGRWTGITRYYRLDDGTLMEFTEQDLAAVRGRLYMVPESINTEINGKPAQASVLHDDAGRRIRRVLWVDGPKYYELLVLSPASTVRPGAAPKAQSPDRSAIELARALKIR